MHFGKVVELVVKSDYLSDFETLLKHFKPLNSPAKNGQNATKKPENLFCLLSCKMRLFE